MNLEEYHYSLDSITDYLNNKLSDKEYIEFSEHLTKCKSCRDRLMEILEDEIFFEEIGLDKFFENHLKINLIKNYIKNQIDNDELKNKISEHLESCKICKIIYESELHLLQKVKLDFNEIMSDINKTIKLVQEYIKKVHPEKDMEKYDEIWNDNRAMIDWEKVEYKEDVHHEKLEEIKEGIGFKLPEIKKEIPFIPLLIRMVTEIRIFTFKNKIKDIYKNIEKLEIHLKKKGFPKDMIKEFLDYISKK